jgi:hypothetical protein
MTPSLQAGDKPAREAKTVERGLVGLGSLLRKQWQRARRFGDLFPWTPLGLVLSGLAYLALKFFARAQLDLVWLVIGYGGLGLGLISPVVVLIAALWLKLRGPLPDEGVSGAEPLLLETGVFSATGFRLPSPFYLPLVQLRWSWASPPQAEIEVERRGGRLYERVRLADRGRFEEIERRVVVSDPFGLSRVVLRMNSPRPVAILPRLAGLSRLPSLRALASGDAAPHPLGRFEGDRIELRRYERGDPARFIHWKVLSRTRKLMVRTEERALSIARRTAAFLIAGEADDASAAVARLALERRLLGAEWLFATDLDLAGTDRVDVALDQLMRSTDVRERAGEGLAAFFERTEREGPTSCLVFAPSRPGAWLDRLERAARRRKLRVVIGVDGVYQQARPHWLLRTLAFHTPPEGTWTADLEQVLRRLAGMGAEVTVLDRGSGQALSAAHRKAARARAGAQVEVA